MKIKKALSEGQKNSDTSLSQIDKMPIVAQRNNQEIWQQKVAKVLVIGSGPIVIGQAAEFDYSGTQACTALREEGIEVVLANSNPATIQTDLEIANRIYIEPLTCEILEKIIEREKPDSILATVGGQTGLNLSMELHEKG